MAFEQKCSVATNSSLRELAHLDIGQTTNSGHARHGSILNLGASELIGRVLGGILGEGPDPDRSPTPPPPTGGRLSA